ncbi:hypothetical protein [Vibrio chagasii]|uniref:hypothetical protein n=1 Tax=Vibrio chagasii TaxID=170679 RepID=UPI003DA0A014
MNKAILTASLAVAVAVAVAVTASAAVKAETAETDKSMEESLGFLHGMLGAGSTICNAYPTPHADEMSAAFREKLRNNDALNQDELTESYRQGLERTDEHYNKIIGEAGEVRELCRRIESAAVDHVYNTIQ